MDKRKPTDRMRLNWLEKTKGKVLWASANSTDGSIQCDSGRPDETFFPSIRQAIDAAMKEPSNG